MEMYKAVYDCPAEPEEASNAQICCLMSVSAIGAQYEWGNYDLQTEAPFYDIAKYYFDNIVQDAELDSIKVCVMLALYNIMNKATVALAYVGMCALYSCSLPCLECLQVATQRSGSASRGSMSLPSRTESTQSFLPWPLLKASTPGGH